MLQTMPQVGTVQWISVRPVRREAVKKVDHVVASETEGLIGDHFSGKADAKRQVTLIQQEHIEAVASIMQCDEIDPMLLRRNIVVSGINLQALKDRRFQIGEAVMMATGNCPPCSRMEENLGSGGYNAMRSHGGITANVVSGGEIKLGDSVQLIIDS